MIIENSEDIYFDSDVYGLIELGKPNIIYYP